MRGNSNLRGRGRIRWLAGALALSTAAGAWSVSPVQAQPTQQAAHQFDIAAQPLGDALMAMGRQSGLQVTAGGELVEGKTSSGVSGRMSATQALSQLLRGSGLTFRFVGANAVRIEPVPEVSGGAITLGPVRVEGAGGVTGAPYNYAIVDRGRTEGSRDYAPPATTTAFKIPLTLQETPQTVVVIPQAAIRDFNLTTVREVLEFTPGIFVRPERSQDYYEFQSRGYDMQVQLDGVPAPNGMGARGRSISPDTAIVDRVEILQGASGLMSGAGAPGGIVNVFRKMPTASSHVELQLGLDSWGGWRGVADISGPLSDSGLGGRLVAVMEERDSFIDYVSGKHAVLYGVLEHRLGDRTTVAVGATLDKIFDYAPGSHYGFPTQVDGSLYPDIPRSRNWGATWSDLEETTYNTFLRLQHRFSERWSVQALITYENFKTRSLQGLPYRERTEAEWPNLLFGSQSEDWYAESYALDIAAQGEVSLFGRDHQLMFGFNGSLREIGGDGGGASPASLVSLYDPADWDARQAPGPYSAGWVQYDDWSSERDNYGGYAGARLSLAKGLHALIGGRLTWYQQSWYGVQDSKSSGVLTPYGALTWDILESLTAYASYTEIFEPNSVTTQDRNNRVLDPITGENKEVGLKLALFDGKLTAQGAVFWLDQVNVAEPDFAGEFPGICGGILPDPCYRASGKIKADGWDVSIAGEIARGLKVLGGYGKVNNEGSYFAPDRSQWSLAASYTAPDDRWNVGVTLRHQSSWSTIGEPYFAEGAGLDYVYGHDGFTVVGLNARYNLNDALSVSGEISNLLDEKYLAQRDWPANGSVWGDPRRGSLTLRAKF